MKNPLNRPTSISLEPLIVPESLSERRNRKNAPKIEFFKTFIFVLITFMAGWTLYIYFPTILRTYHSKIQPRIEDFDWNRVESELEREFAKFEKSFERQWHKNVDERVQRFAAFRKNFYEVQRMNAAGSLTNTTFEMNDFSDWTEEEIQNFLLPLDHFKEMRKENNFIQQMNPILSKALTDDYPEHLDWRPKGVVTPVKAQGKCGSCWAFATAATVESAYAIAHKELRSLSEQELLDCNLDNNACLGGNVAKAFRFVHENGLMLEDEYPYVARRQNSCALAGDTTKIDTAYFLDKSEADMIDWLVNFGPVNIGISVTQDMMSYKSGVFRPSDFDCKYKVLGLHALLVVGYGQTVDGEKYWIVKNSWGQNWGTERGYVYFARGVNACGIEDEPIGLLA